LFLLGKDLHGSKQQYEKKHFTHIVNYFSVLKCENNESNRAEKENKTG
jgi:hypothetical protein